MMDLDLGEVISEILRSQAKLVGLQLPEGLKTKAETLASSMEKETGCQVIVLGDPCYGACDLNEYEGLDMLVHIGHAPIPELVAKVPTMFVEAKWDVEISGEVRKVLPLLGTTIGLIATVQHIHMLEAVKGMLEAEGRKVLIGEGDSRIAHPGQVLGCNISSALDVRNEVNSYLFIGGGYFHPLAVSIGTMRPVFVIDPFRGLVEDLDSYREKVMRQRYAAIALARSSRRWLVIVCSKPGQNRIDLALECLKGLRSMGRQAILVMFNEIRPELLLPFKADAAVCTACPRLAIDDGPNYPMPFLTPDEMMMAIGLRDLDDYRMDQILACPSTEAND